MNPFLPLTSAWLGIFWWYADQIKCINFNININIYNIRWLATAYLHISKLGLRHTWLRFYTQQASEDAMLLTASRLLRVVCRPAKILQMPQAGVLPKE